MQRGTVRALLSLPVSPSRQTPHAQDEVYVIVRRPGVLFHDGRRDPFEAGDFIFVAAGIEHSFEDFTDDLAVWVVFSRSSWRRGSSLVCDACDWSKRVSRIGRTMNFGR